jgi:hypothetical protein
MRGPYNKKYKDQIESEPEYSGNDSEYNQKGERTYSHTHHYYNQNIDDQGGYLDARDHFVGKEVHAAKGFHGYVFKPTHFLVGEKGRERVDISPIRKSKRKSKDNWLDYDFTKGLGYGW